MQVYFQQQITQPPFPPPQHTLTHTHTHFAVPSVSDIPVHGHNSGSRSLNIEGNSIWPCSSDRTYGWRLPGSAGLLLKLTNWRSRFIGAWTSCRDVNPFCEMFLPCYWMSEPLPPQAEGPDRLWVGGVQGTLSWHVQSWNQEGAVCLQMLSGPDLAGGRMEEGRRPEAGQGRRCRGPPVWGLPEDERNEVITNEAGQDITCQKCKQTNHHVVTVKALLLSQ